MRRGLAVTMLSLLLVGPLLAIDDADARAGRGGSVGSRGSRSSSAPAHTPASPIPASHPSPPAVVNPASPIWSTVGGFLAGGLLGSLVFGGQGSGMGLSDLLLLMFLGAIAWKMLRSGAEAAARNRGGDHAALAMGYDRPARTVAASVDGGGANGTSGAPVFDQAALVETAGEIFRQVQSAWSARDMHAISALLTPEMLTTLQKDCDQIRTQGRVNHIDQIAIRAADLVEAWQENGQDYVTLRFAASLLDYTTEDATGAVVEGSQSEPIAFEEFWTFARPVWAKTWRLSAIQQPAPAAH